MIVFGAMIVSFLGSQYWDTINDKLFIMRNDLLTQYYEINQLKHIMKAELGEDYSGNLDEDFDHFVISVVLDRLSEEEKEKFKRYNAFMSKVEMKQFSKTRENYAKNIYGKELNDQTYYIDLNNFVNGITYEKFDTLIPEMKKKKYLIIDLRDNSGGHFDDFIKIADLFLDKDDVIYKIVKQDEEIVYSAENEKALNFEQIVLLINDRTASVAELFVLALTENLDHTVSIGTKTYGKHISYAVRGFNDGSGMRFITSIMQGPNSREISGDGILPDIVIGREGEYYQAIKTPNEEELERKKDQSLQLHKALEFIGY
jgi:C-terminal processing protease CtpA/Prc